MNWEEIRTQAAISALQAVVEGKYGVVGEMVPEIAAEEAVRLADALVEKLQNTPHQKWQEKVVL